jgi:hypothetical protein
VNAATVNLGRSEVVLVTDMCIDSLGETRDQVLSVQRKGEGRNNFAFFKGQSRSSLRFTWKTTVITPPGLIHVKLLTRLC